MKNKFGQRIFGHCIVIFISGLWSTWGLGSIAQAKGGADIPVVTSPARVQQSDPASNRAAVEKYCQENPIGCEKTLGFEKDCAQGVRRGCLELSSWLERGQPSKVLGEQIAYYRARSCELGNARDCGAYARNACAVDPESLPICKNTQVSQQCFVSIRGGVSLGEKQKQIDCARQACERGDSDNCFNILDQRADNEIGFTVNIDENRDAEGKVHKVALPAELPYLALTKGCEIDPTACVYWLDRMLGANPLSVKVVEILSQGQGKVDDLKFVRGLLDGACAHGAVFSSDGRVSACEWKEWLESYLDKPDDTAKFTAACEKKDFKSAFSLLRTVEFKPAEHWHSWPQTERAIPPITCLKNACANDSTSDACALLGLVSFPPTEDKCMRACNADNPVGCYCVAILRDNPGRKSFGGKPEEYYERSCKLGMKEACAKGTDPDVLDRLCRKENDGEACLTAAYLAHSSKGDASHRKQAAADKTRKVAEYLKMGCAKGYGMACYKQYNLGGDAAGLPRGCELGNRDSCWSILSAADGGKTKIKVPAATVKKAFGVLAKQCLTTKTECARVAHAGLANDLLTDLDLHARYVLLESACRDVHGGAAACLELGKLIEKSEKQPLADNAARPAFARACSEGKLGCEEDAKLRLESTDVALDKKVEGLIGDAIDNCTGGGHVKNQGEACGLFRQLLHDELFLNVDGHELAIALCEGMAANQCDLVKGALAK